MQRVFGERAREQVALSTVEVGIAEVGKLRPRLDAFGGDFEAERVGQRRDGPDDDDGPGVKLAETLLVLALAAHLAGGVRLLLVEFVGWRAEWQKSALALGGAAALACALLFALNA